MSDKVKLSCKDVTKLYGDHPEQFMKNHNYAPSDEAIREGGYIPAVRHATFDVSEGEILIVMGLSGSGKSTLIRCLARLIQPTHGQIIFDDIDLLQASKSEMIEIRRHKMGMVFQHFALLPHRNVLQNISFPLEVQGIDKNTRESRAREIIQIVGLEGREDYYPRELSGGQQQRVGIGRSLAVEPDLWFLDEPFSALDPLIRNEMQDEFIRLQSVLNKTIVFITHDFDEAIKLADRIIIMNEGKIVQIGTAEELITNPANDYVGEFTKNVSRAKLLPVSHVMDEIGAPTHPDIVVRMSDRLAQVAGQVLSVNQDVRVVDDNNQPVGVLKCQKLIDELFDQGEPPAQSEQA